MGDVPFFPRPDTQAAARIPGISRAHSAPLARCSTTGGLRGRPAHPGAAGRAEERRVNFGRAANDPELVQESQDDKASGRTQETFGKARRKVGDIVKDIGDSIAR